MDITSRVSGYKYYLVILDDCTHYLWTFPLRLKFDTFSTLAGFIAYASKQFTAPVKAVQCDNGREFDNSSARAFFLSRGIHLRMSCPYTSSQNGKAERIIRSINNVIRSLLFQASMPPSYWVEALSTATSLINILPTKTLVFSTPHLALLGTPLGLRLQMLSEHVCHNLPQTHSSIYLVCFPWLLCSPQRIPLS
jgi:hypothetical protein